MRTEALIRHVDRAGVVDRDFHYEFVFTELGRILGVGGNIQASDVRHQWTGTFPCSPAGEPGIANEHRAGVTTHAHLRANQQFIVLPRGRRPPRPWSPAACERPSDRFGRRWRPPWSSGDIAPAASGVRERSIRQRWGRGWSACRFLVEQVIQLFLVDDHVLARMAASAASEKVAAVCWPSTGPDQPPIARQSGGRVRDPGR